MPTIASRREMAACATAWWAPGCPPYKNRVWPWLDAPYARRLDRDPASATAPVRAGFATQPTKNGGRPVSFNPAAWTLTWQSVAARRAAMLAVRAVRWLVSCANARICRSSKTVKRTLWFESSKVTEGLQKRGASTNARFAAPDGSALCHAQWLANGLMIVSFSIRRPCCMSSLSRRLQPASNAAATISAS